jgi:hypothetical protein
MLKSYFIKYKIKFLPLILLEGYLLFTLLILVFGPVKFNLHSKYEFWLLILFYHIFLILGYVIGITLNKSNIIINKTFSLKYFLVLFFFGIISILVSYKNLMNSDSLIPFNFFNDLIRGFNEPAEVYVERMSEVVYEGAGKSRLLNVFFIFFAFSKLLFIFYSVWFWKFLNSPLKVLTFLYCFFYISPSISAGVNSILFLFIFFIFSSFLVVYFLFHREKLKKLLFKLSFLFLIPILSFGNIMSTRGGSFDYFVNSSSIGDISVDVNDVDYTSLNFINSIYYASVWIDFYLVQGYYGFSLILDKEFKWTYGFGNSVFLQRQFNLLTGIDVSSLTYQRRNDNIWGENSMWHSFYGQFANDFSPYGLVFLMFLLGMFLAIIWKSVIIRNSFFGAALLPMFIIMFIFFPANNQVFGYIDSLSYFTIISTLWFFENFKFKI